MQPEIVPFVLRDPVSASTHLLWCVLGAYVTGILWRLSRGDRVRQLSVGCFGLSITLLYGASGLYHSVRVGQPYLEYFRRLDHSAIYVLIAGTFTPVCAVLLRGRFRAGLLTMIWGLAALGIVCKWALREPPHPVTVGLYVGMGWTGVIPAYSLVRAVGLRAMSWGLLGGLLYTVGGICEAYQWPVLWPHVVGYHEVFHVLDMGATSVHVYFVFRYVLPFQHWDAALPKGAVPAMLSA
jgi:hemolysin III